MDYYERLDFVFPLLISPQITDNSENVVNLQFGELIEQDQQESLSKNMFNHVKRLVMERDDYAEVILRMWPLLVPAHPVGPWSHPYGVPTPLWVKLAIKS